MKRKIIGFFVTIRFCVGMFPRLWRMIRAMKRSGEI